VDIALAALLLESSVTQTSSLPDHLLLAPEVLVPRLGERLIEGGLLERSQLETALSYQQKRARTNQPILLGQALLKLGLVDQATLDRAITEQILQLQDALRIANRDLEKRVRQRTRDLQKALVKLTDLNQLKANFVSNVSHELRTPLTHIKGYIELLLSAGLGPVTSAQEKGLGVMSKASVRLEDLINDLIKFAETSRGEVRLELNPTPVELIIKAAQTRVQEKAQQKKIALKVSLPHERPIVLVDQDNLTWAIAQLLDNAVKFTPEHGQVVTQLVIQDENFIQIEVRDTGIGIPAERVKEIFEPFHQLDGSSTRHHGGTGMGLTLVKQILEAHTVSLNIETDESQGSRFYFMLPIHKRDGARPTPTHGRRD
jgi:signal transduction histidine kinase